MKKSYKDTMERYYGKTPECFCCINYVPIARSGMAHWPVMKFYKKYFKTSVLLFQIQTSYMHLKFKINNFYNKDPLVR